MCVILVHLKWANIVFIVFAYVEHDLARRIDRLIYNVLICGVG